ncbi:MAG: hypothetical protein ACRD2S_00845 [Terriglobales bacterium]
MKKNICLTLCALVMGCASFATTVIPLSVESLTTISSRVIEGRAISAWVQWNPTHTVIFTYTKFQVLRSLKGEAPAVIVVRQLGGTLDGTTEKVAGVRQWKIGEQALLFLRPGEIRDGSLVVTGLMQGNFLIYKGPTGESLVSNGAPDVSVYKASTSPITAYSGSAMRLQDMEGRIQKAVQR